MTYQRRSAWKEKRKRQVRRQKILILCGIIVLFLGIYTFYFRTEKPDEMRASADTEPKITETAAVAEEPVKPEESAEERFQRVKEEAVEQGYPEDIIKLLDKNPETVEFVENYPEQKNRTPANIISEFEKGKIPQLLQWDKRWGYSSYGTSVIASCGCGPTCLSMVFTALTGDNTLTPAKLAEYGDAHGYINEKNDTKWSFMTEAGKNWGIECKEGMWEEAYLIEQLKKGNPIVCSVGPGDFTDKGHFIVLAGLEGNKMIIYDPFSQKNSEKRWEFSEFEKQIKVIWIYSKQQEKAVS